MEPFRVNRGILAQKMMTVIVCFFLHIACQILIIICFHNLIFDILFSAGQFNDCSAVKHGHQSSQLKESVESAKQVTQDGNKRYWICREGRYETKFLQKIFPH